MAVVSLATRNEVWDALPPLRFGEEHPLTELRKPFDAEELHRLALSLSEPLL